MYYILFPTIFTNHATIIIKINSNWPPDKPHHNNNQNKFIINWPPDKPHHNNNQNKF